MYCIICDLVVPSRS